MCVTWGDLLPYCQIFYFLGQEVAYPKIALCIITMSASCTDIVMKFISESILPISGTAYFHMELRSVRLITIFNNTALHLPTLALYLMKPKINKHL